MKPDGIIADRVPAGDLGESASNGAAYLDNPGFQFTMVMTRAVSHSGIIGVKCLQDRVPDAQTVWPNPEALAQAFETEEFSTSLTAIWRGRAMW